ncbi:NAD(P)H-quinone oxidoreductase [Microbulbifer thermotolerans]|uniref:NAD(P)H-quinone oxidoreductase n=1 Tax=Microbulbifer thermotolerans TaxID=252514 RepID=A0A143HKD6_MICTH|nr:NAD(P)H-quinone oxidoreductase [Microbulbifer thermotolerans]AMX02189.1 NAD(P)H-quinone oxidoreductase [Microbulbifer thermotolerans]MCX2781888.1 NAD(P)H-quinone oxidoreductase [Microbulbifer thermotolerans]MCX2800910.1 NAD(P)H-quinone oxidoreductase [Microbulbifer thermotolerans]MCX2834722.1 NAD(P)H-quinone oxidoreductase [Microbulbifer thermotolerans]MCX2841163.1 NAD(P)H-quinone oxidoreductase [Microbulbifer thermotolerans]
MRFIDLPEYGGPEVLQLSEGEKPRPAAGEVLIKVAAAGVNRPDIVQRKGLYPPPPGASPIPGLEVAGEVVAVGEGAVRWHVGDRVCALTNGGGYADYVTVPAGQCLPVPQGLSPVEAAALPETFFTVWSNVFDRGRLQAGEVFLVHGGSSGIGTTAIQLASQFGARVFATAGSDDKCRACESLGAERAINYRAEDFVEVVRAATDERGADVILDMVGGDYIARNMKAAAMDGRIVNIAYLQGAKVQVNMLPVMLKRLILTGSTLRPRSAEEKAAIAQALEEKVWPLIEKGKIRPQVYATFPLPEAAEAHRLMESGAHVGKIVLTL